MTSHVGIFVPQIAPSPTSHKECSRLVATSIQISSESKRMISPDFSTARFLSEGESIEALQQEDSATLAANGITWREFGNAIMGVTEFYGTLPDSVGQFAQSQSLINCKYEDI